MGRPDLAREPTMITKTFRIESRISGLILGEYQAADATAALDAFARDAGYPDYESIPDEARDDDLIVTEI